MRNLPKKPLQTVQRHKSPGSKSGGLPSVTTCNGQEVAETRIRRAPVLLLASQSNSLINHGDYDAEKRCLRIPPREVFRLLVYKM